MDMRFASAPDLTAHDSNIYLSWSNAFTRTLAKLGLDHVPDAPPPPTLAEALAAGAAHTAAPQPAPPQPAPTAGPDPPP